MRIQPVLQPLIALTFLITSCGDDPPPTPAETRSRITADLGNVLHESNSALAGGSALPGAAGLALIDRVVGSSASAQLPAADNVQIDADASVKFFNEQIFTDANHVGDGIYQLPAELVCRRTTVDSAGNATTAVDPDCAAKLAQLDVRIRASTDGDTLTLALQLDADHDEPVRLALTHTSIALTLDFDELQHAEAAIAAVLATDPPSAQLAGQITGKLAVLGSAKIQASLSIDRSVSLQFAAAGTAIDAPEATLLTADASDGLALTLDGNTKSGSFTAALARTVLRLPKIGDKQLELDLPGLSAAATFAAAHPLQLTHLGLGNAATTLLVNGQAAETIDLNPNDGRAFDAQITRDDTAGTTGVTFSPRLDLHLVTNHALINDEPDLFDVTRVQVDGKLTGRDAAPQVRVDGSLAITTNPASYGITASAGQCVTTQPATDPATGAAYNQWTVGACM